MPKKPLKKQISSVASQVVVAGFALAVASVLIVKFASFCVVEKVDDVKRKLCKK